VIAAGLVGWTIIDLRRLGVEQFVAEWPTWLLVLAAACATPLGRWATTTDGPRPRWAAVGRAITVPVATAAAIVGIVAATLALGSRGLDLPEPLIDVPRWAWVVVLALYAAPIGISLARPRPPGQQDEPSRPSGSPSPARTRIGTLVAIAAIAVGYAMLLILTVAGGLTDLQKSVRCKFDLPAIARAMDYLAEHSPPGSVVFTDDWDVFPVCFYYNRHNHYLTGLDPKFTHELDPVLWERYVRLTRGEFPKTVTVSRSDNTGSTVRTPVSVTLHDFVDFFAADYVLVDRDHTPLAERLDAAPEFARRVWPIPGSIDDKPHPPYKVYRLALP
jgi:hypothetical protein